MVKLHFGKLALANTRVEEQKLSGFLTKTPQDIRKQKHHRISENDARNEQKRQESKTFSTFFPTAKFPTAASFDVK